MACRVSSVELAQLFGWSTRGAHAGIATVAVPSSGGRSEEPPEEPPEDLDLGGRSPAHDHSLYGTRFIHLASPPNQRQEPETTIKLPASNSPQLMGPNPWRPPLFLFRSCFQRYRYGLYSYRS